MIGVRHQMVPDTRFESLTSRVPGCTSRSDSIYFGLYI
jgi:hypothetical protein